MNGRAAHTFGTENRAWTMSARAVTGCTADDRHVLARRSLHEALNDARGEQAKITVPHALYLLARLNADEGRWDDALEGARLLIRRSSGRAALAEISGLVVTGLVRARQGVPGVWAALGRAWDMVVATGGLDCAELVAASRAEAAWLEGRHELARRAVANGWELGVRPSAPVLCYWLWRAGGSPRLDVDSADLRTLVMVGEWRAAAQGWDAIGFPYEASMARLDADEDGALMLAFDALARLGAWPLQAMVAERLRRRGVTNLRHLPLQPPSVPGTERRDAAHDLSRRECAVLQLVAQGCSNREIARRLFISPHTAGNHVRAILRKTGTGNRTEAAAVFHATAAAVRPIRF